MAMRGNGGLDSSENEQQMVPAHESVAEARTEDGMQNLFSLMEPHMRRLAREEYEDLVKSGPAMVGGSSVSRREQIQEPDRRNLQLRFQSSLPDSFFTRKKVEGRGGALIRVKLIDTSTGHVVSSGPLSSLKLDVVVLEGDFKNKDDDWTQEIFESHVVKEREEKAPLLTGDLQVSLKEGEGSLGELKFTDNSSWMRSGKFKLGVKVASGLCEGIRVREGKTDAFKVKDRRGESYKKHDLPTLDDDVWRLKSIAKNGAFHKKLNEVEIFKVRHFLWKLGTEPQRLQKILGSSMSNRMWETLVEHSKTCDLSGKYYVYYADNTKNAGVVFKNICELSGIIEGGEYYSAENLSDSQKVYADTLKRMAGDNWNKIVEYDNLIPLDVNPSKRARSECCPFHLDQQVSPEQVLENPVLAVGAPVPCQPPSVPSGEASENSKPDIEGEDPIFGSMLRENILDLPSPSLDPSEQADGNTVLSVEDYDASFGQRIQVGCSNSPRIEQSMQNSGSDFSWPWIQDNIRSCESTMLNLGWLKDLNNCGYFKTEGGNPISLLSERNDDKEKASYFRKLFEIWHKKD